MERWDLYRLDGTRYRTRPYKTAKSCRPVCITFSYISSSATTKTNFSCSSAPFKSSISPASGILPAAGYRPARRAAGRRPGSGWRKSACALRKSSLSMSRTPLRQWNSLFDIYFVKAIVYTCRLSQRRTQEVEQLALLPYSETASVAEKRRPGTAAFWRTSHGASVSSPKSHLIAYKSAWKRASPPFNFTQYPANTSEKRLIAFRIRGTRASNTKLKIIEK